MKQFKYTRHMVLWVLMAGIIFSSGKIFADHDDDDDDEGEHHRASGIRTEIEIRGLPTASTTNAKWKAECATCHMAYPPGLLPERSWRKLMNGLENHFGENASLDEATRKEITDFLVQNSSDHVSNKRGGKILRTIPSGDAPIRISETAYFLRKHDEISPSVFKRKSVGSAANCMACHRGAENGNFSEHEVRIPAEVFPKVKFEPPKSPVKN